MLKYPVKLTLDTNDTLLVTFPDIPETVTFGETRDEALSRALDALECMIMAKMDDREPIPMPSASKGKDFVTLPALSTAKILLYNSMIKAGVSKSELARQIGGHAPQIERLLDLNHASRMDQIERALSVLGLHLTVGLKKVA